MKIIVIIGIILLLTGLIALLKGDCDSCKHKENCPYLEEGKGSCFEISGFEPHYEKKKVKKVKK